MSIIKQTDSRTGIVYAYETEYVWDSEKKQSRRKAMRCIGRVDPETGEITPTRHRCRIDQKQSVERASGGDEMAASRRLFYGATYLLEALAARIGLDKDLRTCFPDTWQQILSIAMYLILEDTSALYRFEKWHLIHRHPYGRDIPSGRSSDLFQSITYDDIQNFFRRQAKRRMEEEYWAYDATSVSSYSELLKKAVPGHNKEHDPLDQINLLLVFGEESGLPFYYRLLTGNVPDVKTVKHLLRELNILGFKQTRFVMDRGFESQANVDEMLRGHVGFLIGMRTTLRLVRSAIDDVRDTLRHPLNWIESKGVYGLRTKCPWELRHIKRNGEETVQTRRLYLYIYYNVEKGADEEQQLNKKIAACYEELRAGQEEEKHRRDYEKYFVVRRTAKRGVRVSVNDEAVRAAQKYYGYFALLSTQKMDAQTALHIYRMKDVVEKAFGNLKERLSGRRFLVSSERSLEGKMFVEFVALILLSCLIHEMRRSGLDKIYSVPKLLDRLDVIECFVRPGHVMEVGEVTTKQTEIFQALGVQVPSSS